MTKQHLINQVSIVIIIGALLSGCSKSIPTPSPSPEQIDKSPFTGIPCAAPCWRGLEVGKSSERDVTSILPTLTFINQAAIQTFRTSMPNIDFSASAPGVNIIANCAQSDAECLKLTVVDNVLTEIVVGLNYEIKPDEAIGYLGNPDYVGYNVTGAERFICEVLLVWSKSRLVLASTFEANEGSDAVQKNCDVVRDTGKFPTDMLILEARYLSNAELNALMSTGTGEFFKFTGTTP